MQRREFLKNTLGGALLLAAARMPDPVAAQSASPTAQSAASKIRGVNLGAWLVLEKWMVPSVYEGTDASDEYNLCLSLGDRARSVLDRHRETFIQADDFRWIASRGLNAVRLPVGYWALEAPKPYIASSGFIDFALDQCRRNGLKLVLDLHGAPGSQNGWDHSGRSGEINWTKPENVRETVRVLETFAQKFGQHPSLLGIELLNEPKMTLPLGVLEDFYQQAYARLRRYIGPGVALVFHDSFRGLAWKNFMRGPSYENVILDTHLYQCFDDEDRARTAAGHLAFALKRKQTLDEMQRDECPVIVGEWSLCLPRKAMRGLSRLQSESLTRAYGDIQLLNYESTRGWFFWSYKLASDSEWNFRHCVERGWLPSNFAI